MLKIIAIQNCWVIRRHDPSLALLGSVEATPDDIALVSQGLAIFVLLLSSLAGALRPFEGFCVAARASRVSFRLGLGRCLLSLPLLILQVLGLCSLRCFALRSLTVLLFLIAIDTWLITNWTALSMLLFVMRGALGDCRAGFFGPNSRLLLLGLVLIGVAG